MEDHVAFDFLRQLVDVSVQNRHRPEPLQKRQRALAVCRAPSPLLIKYVERNVSEDDNRRAGGFVSEVIFKPRQLLCAQVAETATLEVDDIYEPDEVNAMIVKAVPACAFRPLAVPVQIRFATILVDEVMLAGNVVNSEARSP